MHDQEGGISEKDLSSICRCIDLHQKPLDWCQRWDAEVNIWRGQTDWGKSHHGGGPCSPSPTHQVPRTQALREPSLETRLRPGTLPLWGSSRGSLLGTRGDRVCRRCTSSRVGRESHHDMGPITVTSSLCMVRTHCFCTITSDWRRQGGAVGSVSAETWTLNNVMKLCCSLLKQARCYRWPAHIERCSSSTQI